MLKLLERIGTVLLLIALAVLWVVANARDAIDDLD